MGANVLTRPLTKSERIRRESTLRIRRERRARGECSQCGDKSKRFWRCKACREAAKEKYAATMAILRAPAPPKACPWCRYVVTGASRDEKGLWTWSCFEGCNP